MHWQIYMDRVSGWSTRYERVRRYPRWVTGPAMVAVALVVVLPLAVLALAGFLVGIVVFSLLAVVASVFSAIAGVWNTLTRRTDDGRRNVRVIRREPTP